MKFPWQKKELHPPATADNGSLDITMSINLEGISNGHHKMTYRGVPCVKCPLDYVLYQMIIEEVKPDLIIEIGAYKGGSAYYLADLLELYGKGEVHSIDIDGLIDERVKGHKRIKFFIQDWKDYDLRLIKDFKTILVIDDGSHKYDDVIGAVTVFSKFIPIGSYYIIEDGMIDPLCISKVYKGGPLRAIKEFLSLNNNFEIDYDWCDFFGKNATFNVVGYLKRIS